MTLKTTSRSLLVTVSCLINILGLEAKTQIGQKISRSLQQRGYIKTLNNHINVIDKFINEATKKINQMHLKKIDENLAEIRKYMDILTLLQVRLTRSNANDFYNLLDRSYKEDISKAAQEFLEAVKKELRKPKRVASEAELYKYLSCVSIDYPEKVYEPKRVYTFLRINYPEFQRYTNEDWLKMSYKPIQERINKSVGRHDKFNNLLDQTYVRFLRQIESLFRNEFAKQDYDAYRDGPSSLENLLVDSISEREKLKKQITEIFNKLLKLKNKLLAKKS